MKSYHLTPEQVRDIGEKLRNKGELTTTNLVNAALDQVLGEPRYFHEFPDGILYEVDAVSFEAAKGTKFYTPNEQL